MVDIAFIDKEFKSLLNCDAPIKIIKMGKEGCKYKDKNEEYTIKAKERNVIDKTGAGDVVTGVFLGMLAEGKNVKVSLKEAVKIDTKSIGNYGVDFLLDECMKGI